MTTLLKPVWVYASSLMSSVPDANFWCKLCSIRLPRPGQEPLASQSAEVQIGPRSAFRASMKRIQVALMRPPVRLHDHSAPLPKKGV